MTNLRPIRPTQKLPEYGDCLFALQTDEPCKRDEGPFWNLCTRAHSNLAMPVCCRLFIRTDLVNIIWMCVIMITNCARGDTICLRPPCKLTISSHLFPRWHLFRHVGYLRHQQQVDLWPFDLESSVRVTCDVGYLCANFSLPKPLCSRVRPDVRERQTDRRQTKASLNAAAPWDGGIITAILSVLRRV